MAISTLNRRSKQANRTDSGINTSIIPKYPPSVEKAVCTSVGNPVPVGKRPMRNPRKPDTASKMSEIIQFGDEGHEP